MADPFDRFRRFLRELKRRKVYRVAASYAAVSFVLWQAASIVVPALRLPRWVLTLVVVITLAGFPVTVMLAWGWEVTPDRVEPSSAGDRGEVSGEEEPAGEPGLWSRHPRAIALGIAAGLLTLIGIGVWTAGDDSEALSQPDDRVGVAVFPFRTQGEGVAHWTEGAPDLLATALEGTPGVRVVDPWSLWKPLRSPESGDPAAPTPGRADELARDARAHRYVLGSVVGSGNRADLALRLYAAGRDEPVETLQVSVQSEANVAGAVRKAALRLLPHVRPSENGGPESELRFPRAASPQAVNAYLAARAAMRRGRFDSASRAIDRAMTLDSTFVPAVVTAVNVKSWVQYLDGEPYTGLLELVERGEKHAAGAGESVRLHLEMARAQARTHGEDCMEAARQLIGRDSADLMAWAGLQRCHHAFGWQYGAGPAEMRQVGDRILALDSTFVPALARRTGLAAAVGTERDVRRWVARLEAVPAEAPLVRGTLAGLRCIVADPQAFERLAREVAERPRAESRQAFRILRVRAPDRADRLLEIVGEAADSKETQEHVRLTKFRMDAARGRIARLDSLLQAGEVELWWPPSMLLAGADLAGLGRRDATGRVLKRLVKTMPPDSAVAMFDSYPAWQTAWMVAAHQATHGDTAAALRWRRVIGEFPAGGTPRDPWGALQADIDARLAARRGDTVTAIESARRAYRRWDVHTANTIESFPAPYLRLHLAELHRRSGTLDSARLYYRSLVPPTTWLGALTTRSWYRLGEMALESGRRRRAARFFRRALDYWEDGDSVAVGEWRRRARKQLTALTSSKGEGRDR